MSLEEDLYIIMVHVVQGMAGEIVEQKSTKCDKYGY